MPLLSLALDHRLQPDRTELSLQTLVNMGTVARDTGMMPRNGLDSRLCLVWDTTIIMWSL